MEKREYIKCKKAIMSLKFSTRFIEELIKPNPVA